MGGLVKRPRLSRRQTIGVLYGLLGVVLVGYVAGNIESAEKGLSFDKPPDPLKVSFDPAIDRRGDRHDLRALRGRHVLRTPLAAPGAEARSCSPPCCWCPW